MDLGVHTLELLSTAARCMTISVEDCWMLYEKLVTENPADTPRIGAALWQMASIDPEETVRYCTERVSIGFPVLAPLFISQLINPIARDKTVVETLSLMRRSSVCQERHSAYLGLACATGLLKVQRPALHRDLTDVPSIVRYYARMAA